MIWMLCDSYDRGYKSNYNRGYTKDIDNNLDHKIDIEYSSDSNPIYNIYDHTRCIIGFNIDIDINCNVYYETGYGI